VVAVLAWVSAKLDTVGDTESFGAAEGSPVSVTGTVTGFPVSGVMVIWPVEVPTGADAATIETATEPGAVAVLTAGTESQLPPEEETL
jgi:hypothetical protein